MTNASKLPDPVVTRADMDLVEAAARVAETPCAEGVVVWHIWNEQASAEPDAVPLVLLHGGSGSWNHWVRNIPALVRAGYTVYVPDLPGFGDSGDLPAGDDADAMPEWIERGLAQLLGEQRCKLVGFSFGGMVGTLLAAHYPARVERLVIVGSPGLSDKPLRMKLRAWNHLPAGPERDGIIRNNLLMLMVAHPETMDEPTLQMHIHNLTRDRLQKRRLSQTDIVVRSLPEVECPLYGIWGERDALYLDRQDTIAPALSQAPHFRTLAMIKDAGHWVQYESAQAFDAALLPMLVQPAHHAG